MDRPSKRLRLSSPSETPIDTPVSTRPGPRRRLICPPVELNTESVLEVDRDTSASSFDPDSAYNQEASLQSPSLKKAVSFAPDHLFQNASHFVINNSTFIMGTSQNDSKTPSIHEQDGALSESTAIRLLLDKSIPEASLDSSARYPPPRCHEGTRVEIQDRIFTWLNNPNRTSNLLWLQGPAGVGKSALAQTITEHCQDQGWIIAAFFFSRPNKRDDPNRLVPSLAYQLTVKFLAYKHLLKRLLTDDPTILGKALPVQFQRLIVEPLLACFNDPAERVLIVLDGLDECRGDSAQREIITLIVAFSHTFLEKKIPVFFMIFSRPEWQIVSTFSKEDPLTLSRREELSITDNQSLADFSLFLRERFKDIRSKYDGLFADIMGTDSWPSEEQLHVLIAKGSGLFAFGEAALRFIEDDDVGDPINQLDICLDFLKGNKVPVGVNPFDPLASLYRGILRNVHQRLLPTSLHLLGASTRSWPVYSTAFHNEKLIYISAFMGWGPALYLSCLQRLRSVVRINGGNLEFYHSSFEDFLVQILETGEFGLTWEDITNDLRQRSLEWYRIWKRDGDDPSEDCIADFEKLRPSGAAVEVYRTILGNAFMTLQWALLRTSSQNMFRVIDELKDVNFADLYYWGGSGAGEFEEFLRSLTIWQQKSHDLKHSQFQILRCEAHSRIDEDLAIKYSPLLCNNHGMRKLDVDGLEKEGKGSWKFTFLTLPGIVTDIGWGSSPLVGSTPTTRDYDFLSILLDPRPMYFFLGQGSSTSLVLAWREGWELIAGRYIAYTLRQLRDFYSIPNHWHSDLEEKLNNLFGCSLENRSIGTTDSMSLRFTQVVILLRFIGDTRFGDPVRRLDEILQRTTRRYPSSHDHEYSEVHTDIIKGDHRSGHTHPNDQSYYPINQLLSNILFIIPAHNLTHAYRLILFLECGSALPRLVKASHGFRFSFDALSSFLGIHREVIEDALELLNPIVLKCPQLRDSQLVDDVFFIRLSGANGEWLEDPDDDHNYFIDRVSHRSVWIEASAQCVRWCNSFLTDQESLFDGQSSKESESFWTDWGMFHNRTQRMLDPFTNLIFLNTCWVTFGRLARAEPDSLVGQLRGLSLCQFELSSKFELRWTGQALWNLYGNWSPFLWCMNELYYFTRKPRNELAHMVRLDCQNLADRRLLAKLGKLRLRYSRALFPLRQHLLYRSRDAFPAWVTVTLNDASPMGQGAVEWKDARKYIWQAFLLGYGVNSCLVLVRDPEIPSIG